MSTVDRLEGVWNIVPTPFLEDGALDEAQPPDADPVRGRAAGVDGMTILGVLGEAAKLSDDGAVDRDPRRARRRPATCRCASASRHAATDRAIAFAREAEAPAPTR